MLSQLIFTEHGDLDEIVDFYEELEEEDLNRKEFTERLAQGDTFFTISSANQY